MRRVVLILATCITTRAVTSPEEATAACALENDAVASCDGDDANRRLQGDDDDAATFCSFAGPTLAAQCDTRDTCAAEYRAYLTCYYRALCEDPSLGCAPLAADDPPVTAPPATVTPPPSSCGDWLEPVGPEDCPAWANTLWPCDVVACGELCEGNGECGTDGDLNNCGGGFDIYRKICPSPAPTASPAPSSSPAPSASPAPTASPAPSYSPAPTATQVPTYELRGCRRLLRHTDPGYAHRLLSRGCSDDATAVRLGGVCAATVWLIVVAVATWLLVA